MAFIRCTLVAVAMLLCIQVKAQMVYYPEGASQLLKETAADMAGLLQKATGRPTSVQPYTSIPNSGIVFIYDSTVAGNQSCTINGSANGYLTLAAAQDNGLVYGAYRYLYMLGFRFYQPGEAWQLTPSLNNAFINIQATVSGAYKYAGWFISGGHNRWAMDNSNDYNWDTYFGKNGHEWALYQRRNGMGGAHRFAGHRTDIIAGNYLTQLQNNPCYVACYNGNRTAGMQSVPDLNNNNAVQIWANALAQQYTQYRNTILGNPTLYANQYRNFAYNNQLIGLEAPDGAQWGNSADNGACLSSTYPSASDQQFTLVNAAVAKVNGQYPNAAFQCYAYSSHANVPSAHIGISNKLDVQVIPTAFQAESSGKGLLNRWYNRHGNISEYHYLNIPQWGGETPMLHKTQLEQTLARLREKNGQGVVWEASPAKFASLPYLLAANRKIQQGIPVDSTLKEFSNQLFGPAAAAVYQLLQLWGDEQAVTNGDFIPDNKYKLPLYLNLVNTAAQQASNASAVVQERIAELKAYLHYMVLYYNWLADQRSHTVKAPQAAELCLYLASVHRLQIVNSYFLIADISSRYGSGSAFYQQYNPSNGTAYQNGNLPLITREKIEQLFAADMALYGNQVQQYRFVSPAFIKAQFSNNAFISPAKKIAVKIGYTNGYEYPGKAEYMIDAPTAGSFVLQYVPRFDIAGKGQVNFTVEAADKALEIIKDFTINNGAAGGTITVNLPTAGRYKLTVSSRFKTAVDLVINTNNNLFYKDAPFLGNKIENYRGNLLNLPGYFYVPTGVDRVYFSINNGNPGGSGFAKAADMDKAFVFKDNNGNTVNAQLASTSDSALFYLPIPAGGNGHFWQVVKMEQYNLCFANINNQLWYASRKPCASATFTASIINRNGLCITRLKTNSNSAALQWQVYDASKWLYFTTAEVELPDYVSPNALITLKTGTQCMTTQRLGDDEMYMRQRAACASGAPIPVAKGDGKSQLYPNPSTGIFNLAAGTVPTQFDELTITDSKGQPVAKFKVASQFDISHLPAGLYLYQCIVKGEVHKGRLVKL